MAEKKGRFPVWFWIIVVLVLILLAVAAVRYFSGRTPSSVSDTGPTYVDPGQGKDVSPYEDDSDGGADGFSIQLSDGQAQPAEIEPVPLAASQPLGDEAIQAILARLPAMPVEETDQQEFKLPEDVLPPPRPGQTIEQAFPLQEEVVSPAVESGPLEVLRYSPEGEVSIAPLISVTFNQPMVPLTTLDQLSQLDIPLRVTPELKGRWSWIGSRTLTFQHDSSDIDRLPMATEYTLTIPVGTRSLSGGELAQTVTWQFSTPPPQVVQFYPTSDYPQPLQPLMFVSFDQQVEPSDVLSAITATADGKNFDISRASQSELEADETVSRLVENSHEGRWLVFKAKRPLPKDAQIEIAFNAGLPSAEGPLVTTQMQNFGFRTYAPLKVVDHGCSWSIDTCYPLSPFYIEFNNPIDPDKFEESMISIKPELPGSVVSIFGNTINIQGPTAGRTTYHVTIDSSTTDIFGQQLGRDEKLTFRVNEAKPLLVGPDNILVTLDPSSTEPALSLYTINYDRLDVKIYAVLPSDWLTFKQYLRDFERTDQPMQPPGDLVLDDTIKVDSKSDELTEVNINLKQVMQGEYGHFIVIVKPPKGFFEKENYWEAIQVWTQVTQIGLDAFADSQEMLAWTTSLKDGSPLEGVSIQSNNGYIDARTGADGLARFDLPHSEVYYLVAQKGEDRVILPRSEYAWGDDSWYPRTMNDQLRWYVFDDRAMYRPGEEVHVKGWLRLVGGKQTGDVSLVGEAVDQISYQFIDPQGNELGNGSAAVNALGGFDLSFTLPENTNLGYAQLSINALGTLPNVDGRQYYHQFQIQEFRRPEFEVNARNESSGPFFAGGEAMVAVEAKYYAGGPLPSAETNWYVSSSPTNYQPPNWPEFTFGSWTPWWYFGWYEDEMYYGEGGYSGGQSFTGSTDASGTHYLRMEFSGTGEPQPYTVTADASVTDVNFQTWGSSTSLIVHPSELYVGLRSTPYFVERGTPIEVEAIVTDLDGSAISGQPVTIIAVRLQWQYEKGRWRQVELEPQECAVTSGSQPISCTFKTEVGGRYQITALVSDDLERQNRSRITRWVSGGEQPPSREVEQEQAELVPDQETYQPGDVAHVLVQSPFSPAEGLLTVTRSGILYTERFVIEEGATTLDIPIEEAHIPNLNIQVDLVGCAARTDELGDTIKDAPPRPAYASGQLTLNIPPLSRTLSLEVEPRQTMLSPAGSTTIDVTLKDAAGKPVPDAELALVVVDEAILALTNYRMLDPISVFYYSRPSDLSSNYGRSSIVLVDPYQLAEQNMLDMADEMQKGEMMVLEEAAPAPMAADMESEMVTGDRGGGGGEPAAPIMIRTDFNPLALFAPQEHTNENGKASLKITLPDNLTRYRVMVVAVDPSGKQFGSGEANITARLPLMVRPAVSRFLNFGDVFELPVVLQNQTDQAMSVDVIAQTSNLQLTGYSGLNVTVPANDRVQVRFPGTTLSAGSAHVRFAAVSGADADAATISLPVYTPATSEAYATYGVIDEGAAAQPVAYPEGVFPQYGGLEITTSSTALHSLSDAVLYLVTYPFDCSEQIASRMLAIAALREMLPAFNAEGLPSVEEMEVSVTSDIEMLRKIQNYDGGFPYWRRGRDSIPFNTVHAAFALQQAREMGFEVPEDMWQNALNYLRDIENYYPSWYSLRTRQTISAYALFVRHQMDDTDANKTRLLLDDAGVENLPLEATAWIWEVLQDTPDNESRLEDIRRHVNNSAVETAGAANFTTSYDDNDSYLLLHSDRRTDALLLSAIIGDDPNNDLIPKLVTGLQAHRIKGRWNNTQENVFVLLALERYFETYEAQEPEFIARLWLGETYAGSSQFSGYSTDRHQIDVPMAYLMDATAETGTQDLILSKTGNGRLYYRLGLRYAPTDLVLPPLDMGFVVQRSYEAVDDPDDVSQDSDGIWHIKAGARVRVRITMVADNRRYHVALVDPLPAGLEIINPALAVSESIPADPSSPQHGSWWWWWRWYDHQNMRDERVEAFAPLLWDGVYEYTYVTRATMTGTFVAPPAKAEEMYSPEVFGRSSGDIVVIE